MPNGSMRMQRPLTKAEQGGCYWIIVCGTHVWPWCWYCPYIFYSCLNTNSMLAIDRDVLEYQFTMQIEFADSNNKRTFFKNACRVISNICPKYIQNIQTLIKNNHYIINIHLKTDTFLFLLLPVLIKTFISAVVLVAIWQMWQEMNYTLTYLSACCQQNNSILTSALVKAIISIAFHFCLI